MARGGKVKRSALAVLFGWLTGLLATLPFQVVEVVRNSGAAPRLFLPALGFGLAIWVLYTLVGILIGWLLLVLPLALLCSGEWLVGHERRATLLSGLFGAMVAMFEFRIWSVFDHWPTDLTNFWLYLVFTVSFAAATCWFYVRLLTRSGRERYAQHR